MQNEIRFVSPVERALYLRTIGPLQTLSASELAEMALRLRERRFRKGARLYRAGEPPLSFHIVVEGQVRVQGDEQLGDGLVGPRSLVGLLSIYARSKQEVVAIAETEVMTLEGTVDDLYDLLEDNSAILSNALKNLSTLLLELRKEIVSGTRLARSEKTVETKPHKLDLIERLLFLRQSLGFSRANMDALVYFVSQAEEIRFAKGSKIWDLDDPSGYYYILVNGYVHCELSDGRFFQAGTGYPLGNLESLSGQRRWYRATAETPVVALRSETDQIYDVIEDHFGAALSWLEGMAAGILAARRELREREEVT